MFLQTGKRMLIKYYCGVSAVLFTCVFSYAKSAPCQSTWSIISTDVGYIRYPVTGSNYASPAETKRIV